VTLRRTLAALARDQHATTAAEFALVVPLFLGLVFLTINGSIMLSAAVQTHYAAERAARCLSVNVSGDCSLGNIDAYAKTYYNGPTLTGMTFTGTSLADYNQVDGTGTYELITGLGNTSVTISSTARYPKI